MYLNVYSEPPPLPQNQNCDVCLWYFCENRMYATICYTQTYTYTDKNSWFQILSRLKSFFVMTVLSSHGRCRRRQHIFLLLLFFLSNFPIWYEYKVETDGCSTVCVSVGHRFYIHRRLVQVLRWLLRKSCIGWLDEMIEDLCVALVLIMYIDKECWSSFRGYALKIY